MWPKRPYLRTLRRLKAVRALLAGIIVGILLLQVLVVLVRTNKLCRCVGKRVHIALAADATQRKGMLALMNSILSNTACPQLLVFHLFGQAPSSAFQGVTILSHDLPPVPVLSRFINHQYDEFQFPRGNLKALENYVRFFLADILKDVHSCWWLDSDIIVQGDLNLLTQKLTIHHLTSNAILAAFPRKRKGFTKKAFHRLQYLGIDVHFPSATFNAGILYLNLATWRERNLTSTLEAIARVNARESLYPDSGSQPPLQLAVGDMFEKIPSTFIGRLGYKNGVNIDPAAMFLHWNGQHKPWLPTGKYVSYWAAYAVRESSNSSSFEDCSAPSSEVECARDLIDSP